MNRRGVSPVVAVLLLVVITVAAAVLVYIWLIGFMQSQTTTTGSTALGERLKFETVSLTKINSTHSNFTAYVRNIGDTAINITTAYLLEADGQTLVAVGTIENDYLVIGIGDNERIVVIFDVVVNKGKTYVVKLVSSMGTEFTVKVKAI